MSIVFIPLLMAADPNCSSEPEPGLVLSGETSGANRCVEDLLGQITIEPNLNINHHDRRFRIRFPEINWRRHVQGISRLRDWAGKGRMAISDNSTNAGFRVVFQDIVNAEEGLFSAEKTLADPVAFPIRNVAAFGDHDHPGGMQAQGDLVAIAMEGGSATHAAVYFLSASGDQISFLDTLWLDGSQGEPYQGSQNAAATAGLVQLKDGSYLVAVSGKNHGRQGIWFYVNSGPEINAATRWVYRGFYEPQCVGYGDDSDNCFVGAGGGMALLTDCSGAIFLLAMHGTSGSLGREYEYLQAFLVLADEAGGVSLQKYAQQRDCLGLAATNNMSFRWSGGAFVSKRGELAIFNTERRRNENDNDFVDGHVYLGKLK